MKRRALLKGLLQVPAAFVLAKYGLPVDVQATPTTKTVWSPEPHSLSMIPVRSTRVLTYATPETATTLANNVGTLDPESNYILTRIEWETIEDGYLELALEYEGLPFEHYAHVYRESNWLRDAKLDVANIIEIEIR